MRQLSRMTSPSITRGDQDLSSAGGYGKEKCPPIFHLPPLCQEVVLPDGRVWHKVVLICSNFDTLKINE